MAVALATMSAGRLAAQDGAPAREFDGETRILRTDAGDEQMNAAIGRARATVPQLVARLKNPPPGLTYLGVKVLLGDPDGGGEHIWLFDVTFTEGRITGRLVENSLLFPEVRAGSTVGVDLREISDWMTVENGRACGGFTNRIMIGEMTAEERAAYMAEMRISRLPPDDTVCDDDGPAQD